MFIEPTVSDTTALSEALSDDGFHAEGTACPREFHRLLRFSSSPSWLSPSSGGFVASYADLVLLRFMDEYGQAKNVKNWWLSGCSACGTTCSSGACTEGQQVHGASQSGPSQARVRWFGLQLSTVYLASWVATTCRR